MRVRSATLVALVLSASLVALAGGGGSRAAERPHLFVTPGGVDNGNCSQSAPCRSLRAAYAVAPAGSVVEIAGGQYGSQVIPQIPSKENATQNVVFQPAAGARVTLGPVKVYGSHLELRDLAVDGYDTYSTAHDVVFRRVSTPGFWIWSSADISVIGGAVGPMVNDTPYIAYQGGSSVPPRHIVIDGVRFHDMTANGGTHTECLMISGGEGIVVRRSSFRNCFYFDIFFTQWSGPGAPSGILLENNVFAAATNGGFYSVYFSDHIHQLRDVTLRYNSALQSFGIAQGLQIANVSFIANVAPTSAGECNKAATYAYNVWDGARCGPTDRNAPARYLAPSALNLRVGTGSAAINHGDPKDFPHTDFAGRRRPSGSRPDAGAFEIR